MTATQKKGAEALQKMLESRYNLIDVEADKSWQWSLATLSRIKNGKVPTSAQAMALILIGKKLK